MRYVGVLLLTLTSILRPLITLSQKNSHRQPAVAVFLTVQDGKQKREYVTHRVKYKEPPCCGALPFPCPETVTGNANLSSKAIRCSVPRP